MTASTVPRRSLWRPLGLRREVLILMPLALLLLITLSTFTLFSYRNAVNLLTEERQEQAARWARRMAEQLSSGSAADLDSLARRSPEIRALALLGSDGVRLAGAGTPPAVDWFTLVGADPPEQPQGYGPSATLVDSVVGVAPLAGNGGRRYVRVDLAAPILAAQRRSLPLLSAVVLGINGALGVLLILFLRHLLVPYETLLARARQLAEPEDEGRDETALLVSTFERAVEALAARSEAAGSRPEDDIAALERTLSASLESGLLLLDRRGAVLAVNPVGTELLALSAEMSGTPLEDILGAYPEFLGVLREAIGAERGIQRRELTVETPRGELALGLSVHPLRRDDDVLRGYLVLFADLTEVRQQAQETRLAEGLAQLGELAAGVAHELRNSLATLSGYLTLIERSPEEEAVADYLAEIRAETAHLQRILEDFLSFARPGTARVEEVRVGELVERAAADPALAGARVRVRDAGGGALCLRGDSQLLLRTLRNLLHNAVQADRERRGEGEEAEVDVRMTEVDGEVEIAVEDRGPGLPEDVRRRLFQPFVTGRFGGVGLGLALSHRIVSLHGGRLRLDDRPGGGTRARMTFPLDTFVTDGNDPRSRFSESAPAPSTAQDGQEP